MRFDDIRTLFSIQEANGYDDLTLTKTEQRLSQPLPSVLKQYYSQLGNYQELNHCFNQLTKPDQLQITNSSHLVFYEENQGVATWGIQTQDLSMDNPPVYGSYDNGETWSLDAPSLSDFFISMAYLQASLGGLPYSANTMEPDKNEIRSVKQHITEWKEIKEKNSWYNEIYTFDGKQVIFIMTDSEGQWQGIFLACSQEDEFNKLLDDLNINWSYVSDEDEESDEDDI